MTSLDRIAAPAPLRALRGWLVWRRVQDGKKVRKVPYYAAGGARTQHGTEDDRARLATFDQALAAARKGRFDGIGFATLPEFGVVALDFDNVIHDGELEPRVATLVAGTYAERSPSGRGVRAFFVGELPDRKTRDVEVFHSAGFVTVTGDALDHVGLTVGPDDIAPVPPALRALVGPIDDDPFAGLEPRIGLTTEQLAELLTVQDPNAHHDEWIRVGMALHHETAGQGFDLWDAWSSKGETYPGTDALRRRWESFGRERPSSPVTARSLVKAGAERGIHLAADPRAVDAEAKSGKPSRFQVIPAASFAALPPTRWIVKGLLPQAELAVLYGESGSGKSFVVLDIALAIARGVPWRGLRVRQGRVVYIAAEGAGGVRGRLAAYAKHNGVDLAGVDLSVIADVPNLLDKTDAAALARAIGQADVVVLDTLAQATPGGNENSSEDMGKALGHAKAIHRATGALVLIIHHAGKDASRGARGWSGIRAALDAELEVVRMPVGRLLRTTKQKDGDDRSTWGFDLEVVNLGVDEDGDVVSSCVVTEAAVQEQGLARKLGPIEKAIAEAVARNDGDAPVEVVISEVVETIAAPAEGARDTRRDRVRRALRALCEGQDAPFWMADGRIERL